MVTVRRRGFTLIEAIVALTLSSVVVVLVSTTFLVQNTYYALQAERSATQENARAMTDLVATEIRSTLQGGIIFADSNYLGLRVPVTAGVVCALPSGNVTVHLDGGLPTVSTDEVVGFAQQTDTTQDWSYFLTGSWAVLHRTGGDPAGECAANGADTVGASDEFVGLNSLSTYSGVVPGLGDVVVLFRNVNYQILQSQLDSTVLGLFQGQGGGSLIEVTTGLDPSAGFQYRAGGSSYVNSVSGAALLDIDAVRLVAQARKPPVTGGRDDVTFGWSVNVHLRNRR